MLEVGLLDIIIYDIYSAPHLYINATVQIYIYATSVTLSTRFRTSHVHTNMQHDTGTRASTHWDMDPQNGGKCEVFEHTTGARSAPHDSTMSPVPILSGMVRVSAPA